MGQTPRLAAAALAVCLAGCATSARLGSGHPGVPPSTTAPAPPAPAPSTTQAAPTTAALSGDGANAIAARFAVAYFDWRASDPPDARRRRCRPFDTDALDQLLAVPSWAGAGNTTSSPQDSTAATIDTVNQVETAGTGAGFELTVTVATTTAGGVASDQRGLEIWVTSTAAGWRVSQMSVAS
jgi:hypothetical protein